MGWGGGGGGLGTSCWDAFLPLLPLPSGGISAVLPTAASFAYSISASTMPGFQSMRSLLCALLAMVIVLCRDS